MSLDRICSCSSIAVAAISLTLGWQMSAVQAAEPATGWRGNATGLWPDAAATMEWHRLAHGAMEGLRGQANRPIVDGHGDAPLIHKGLVREWLLLRHISVKDTVNNLDDDLLAGEPQMEPTDGDRAAGLMWQKVLAPFDDPMVFGTALLPLVELAKTDEFEQNRVAYAHTYVFSPQGGMTRGVVDHCFGLKVWVNGRQVYRSPERTVGLGVYPA